MIKCQDESKLLASLSVFRELYDSNNDVLSVLSEFIKETIILNGVHQFNITELTLLLNNTFHFSIPEAVVLNTINKLDFIEKNNGYYIVKNLLSLKTSKLEIKQKESKESCELLILRLFDFIIDERGTKLNDNEKEKIVESLYSYLLDEFRNQEFYNYISAFIIKNKSDVQFTSQLNLIKEGVILYTGIKNDILSLDLSNWKKPLTIFIDTEVLIYFGGFSGEVYKTLFADFFSLVKEINIQSNTPLIYLKYFPEVSKEIDVLFSVAESIVQGKDKLIPSKTAMASIVKGCKSSSDVVEKKVKFYELLSNNGIIEDTYNDYFIEENHKYNIIDKTTIKTVASSLCAPDISENLRFLNFVNIKRKGVNANSFENIGYILLSGNSLTQRLAWHNDIKREGHVPLATNLNFITNRFWFKLNKGFGSSNKPISFDILTKAQIILSSQLNECVSSTYDLMQHKFKKGELSEQQAISIIANLRNQTLKPEEILPENASNVLSTISEDSIEKHISEQEHLKNIAEERLLENMILLEDLETKKKIIENKDKENETLVLEASRLSKQIIINDINSKNQILNEKNNIYSILHSQKIQFENIALNKYSNFKKRIGFLLFLGYLSICFFVWYFKWDVIEAWTYVIGLIFISLIPFIYTLIYENNINVLKFLKKKKELITNNTFSEYKFDLSRFERIKLEIKELEEEIMKSENVLATL